MASTVAGAGVTPVSPTVLVQAKQFALRAKDWVALAATAAKLAMNIRIRLMLRSVHSLSIGYCPRGVVQARSEEFAFKELISSVHLIDLLFR